MGKDDVKTYAVVTGRPLSGNLGLMANGLAGLAAFLITDSIFPGFGIPAGLAAAAVVWFALKVLRRADPDVLRIQAQNYVRPGTATPADFSGTCYQ